MLSGNRVWNFAALEGGGGDGGWRFLLHAYKKLQTISCYYLIVSFALLLLLAFTIQVHIII